MNLTFGEQIKILLNRENRTIKNFAEQVEAATGMPCSRQNLTQKLKRDNFQEQDMRTLASILGYEVQITLVPLNQPAHPLAPQTTSQTASALTPPAASAAAQAMPSIQAAPPQETAYQESADFPNTVFSDTELLPNDCIDPQTGEEYQTNTVRAHPSLTRFIQVYDQNEHTWTDISEDYFLKFQEQKRKLLGRDYIPPVYI